MNDVKLSGGLQLIKKEALTVKFKKLSENAVAPKIMREGDCGADLTATSMVEKPEYIEYGTSLAVVIPEGFVGVIAPRSSLSNYDLILANHLGIIDQNFRGEITFRFKVIDTHWNSRTYKVGDRIGQLLIIPLPQVSFEEVEELSETNRGTGAYGSSGK